MIEGRTDDDGRAAVVDTVVAETLEIELIADAEPMSMSAGEDRGDALPGVSW